MDSTQTDTGQREIVIRSRSGECRWYRVIALYLRSFVLLL